MKKHHEQQIIITLISTKKTMRMKKIFTLFAVAAMTMSVSAETVYLCNPEKVKQNILSGEDMGAPEGWTLQCMNTAKNLESGSAITVDGDTYIPIKFSNGAQNTLTLPEGYVVTKLTFYTTLNIDAANRTSYWAEVAGVTYTEEDNNGLIESYKEYDNPNVQSFTINNLREVTFKNTGEQPLAVIAVEYKEGSAEPELPLAPAHEEGETFTLEGVYPQGDFGTIKTPLTIDYEAKTLTFAEFLGGTASLVCKYELRDPNADPTMPTTMFNIIPVSGVTEAGEVYGDKVYDLDGLKSMAVAFSNDNANTIKLNAPQIMFGTYSSMQYMTGGKYDITLYLSSKNQQWVADNWGEESDMGYFNLKITVPASGNQSGIEDIVAGEDENAPVEYYNLQGVRINEPAAGQVVIRRQGSKVTKIVVR